MSCIVYIAQEEAGYDGIGEGCSRLQFEHSHFLVRVYGIVSVVRGSFAHTFRFYSNIRVYRSLAGHDASGKCAR
jgi:hypothetical protein